MIMTRLSILITLVIFENIKGKAMIYSKIVEGVFLIGKTVSIDLGNLR